MLLYKRAFLIRIKRVFSDAQKILRNSHVAALSPWLPSTLFTIAILIAVPQSSAVVDPRLLDGPALHLTEASSRQQSGWDYFLPSWTAPSGFGLLSLFDGDLLGWDANALVEDPSGLLETEFSIPLYLKNRVAFWVRVYSQYGSNIRIVHDRNQVDFIYGIIDLRPLYRELGNTGIFEIRANQIEKRVVNRLRKLILRAVGEQAQDPESAPVRALISRFGALNTADAARLAQSIRTQSGQRDMFLRALHRSRELLPHIESVLRQHGLPVTLARIPFVESSFNPKAQSKIGAMGIWQFTPATAREWIHADDPAYWFDPIRQTKSAAKLLRGYRALLPDWSTTITSYNSGIGRIRRLSRKYKAENIDKLISTRDPNGLGFAGKNFFAEVLAATIVEAYKDKLFGEHLLPSHEPELVATTPDLTPDRCEH